MLRQLCNDGGSNVLIENNGVIQKWVAIPFWNNWAVFNVNSITSVIAECRNIDADAWYKRGLNWAADRSIRHDCLYFITDL